MSVADPFIRCKISAGIYREFIYSSGCPFQPGPRTTRPGVAPVCSPSCPGGGTALAMVGQTGTTSSRRPGKPGWGGDPARLVLRDEPLLLSSRCSLPRIPRVLYNAADIFCYRLLGSLPCRRLCGPTMWNREKPGGQGRKNSCRWAASDLNLYGAFCPGDSDW